MKPDEKVKVIQLFQEKGWVVGMAGDGGNDCGMKNTLKMQKSKTNFKFSF